MLLPLLQFFGASWALLLIILLPRWRSRTVLAALYMIGYAGLVWWLSQRVEPQLYSVLLPAAYFHLYSGWRVVQDRLHHKYLKYSTFRAVIWWTAISGLFVGLAVAYLRLGWSTKNLLLGLSVAIAATATILLLTTVIRRIAIAAKPLPRSLSDDQLPTVSVLIPARNEDEALMRCLEQLTKSDYLKLEIIVFDDCSYDKTSEVVRHFAQHGVQFIPGTEPAGNWLAKNAAYDALASAANGELLLFIGVDVLLGEQAIMGMVEQMVSRQLAMISLLPQRQTNDLVESICQPLRYWWLLALPRDIIRWPAVLSTCWMIRKKELQHLGGFESVSRAITPEMTFARQLARSSSYQFLRLPDQSVVTSKNLAEQYNTAVRTLYPMIHRRPERLMLSSLWLIFMLLPYVLLPVAIWQRLWAVGAMCLAAVVAQMISQLIILTATKGLGWALLGSLALPWRLLQELGLLHISFTKYEFGEVIWKERNVCYPVMHVEPHLPPLK